MAIATLRQCFFLLFAVTHGMKLLCWNPALLGGARLGVVLDEPHR